MQYFKTQLSLPATLLAPARASGYRRTLRYGHARLKPRDADRSACDERSTDTSSVRLHALPRVQAVVDAMILAAALSDSGENIRAHAA
jgi:hypothetical protein